MQKKHPGTPALADVAAAESRRLADDPNIVCVGVGLKHVAGKPHMVAALRYHVRTKHGSAAEVRAAGSDLVPAEVGGYPTDVAEWKLWRIAAGPSQKAPTGGRGGDKEDPLVGGTSTTVLSDFHSFPTGYGTLGGICFDAADGRSMALSNAHVYGDETGNDVIQPWLSISNYLAAALEVLYCGPAFYVFTWTAPSPATGILTTAAAAAWTAAALSDAEDPTRWGQRTTAVPSAGTLTTHEQMGAEAALPRMPFPGRQWATKARWDYARHTTAGVTHGTSTEERPNEHVLIGKRVFTDRPSYAPGGTVTTCAELWSAALRKDEEYFVVAHYFPLASPDSTTKRIMLTGGPCEKYDARIGHNAAPICVHGFKPQVEGIAQIGFPYVTSVFRLWSGDDATVLKGNWLRLPTPSGISIACPPSTYVEIEVVPSEKPVHATAYSANGVAIDQAVSSSSPGLVQTLVLTGPEIVRVTVAAAAGDCYLAGICVDKRKLDPARWKAHSQYYSTALALPRTVTRGTWGVVVVAQSLDKSPVGADPVAAARRLGGIVASANVAEVGACACAILFDCVFEVG